MSTDYNISATISTLTSVMDTSCPDFFQITPQTSLDEFRAETRLNLTWIITGRVLVSKLLAEPVSAMVCSMCSYETFPEREPANPKIA
jgi:hypothetical protein